MYIAQDAHASKCTYEKLVELKKYGNVPQNAVPGLPVIIYQEDGQKIIAYGTWSSLNSEENAVIDNTALHNSDKILAIEVQKVSVPGKSLRVTKIWHSKTLDHHLAQENKYMFQFNELKVMKQPKKLLL